MKKPRIVIEEQENGAIRLKVDNVHGEQHAIFLLATSINLIVTEEKEVEDMDDFKAEVSVHAVQELPTADQDKE